MTLYHTHVPIITSTRNHRIVEASKLAQRKYRQQQNRFLVEGLQLLHMALDAGLKPLDVFYCEEQFAGEETSQLLDQFAARNADLVPVSEHVMRKLSPRCMWQGIVTTFEMFDTTLTHYNLADDALVLVLDRLQDTGNVGTLIRTADAVGVAGVVLIAPSVDIFDPKVVRASMGSLFTLPVMCSDDIPGLFDWLNRAGLRPVGADLARGHWEMASGGAALVLGNEARGLSDDVWPYLADWVRLPMRGSAESLNVAVAGGVLMYDWLRVNC
ncbi:MAG: RNA methyltransferase [Anaerolineae bacterium]|nr:RNA methyltransferase [Anaerolineae bacterium]